MTPDPSSAALGPGPVIGVLDLQGDVREHLAALYEIGATGRRVKRPEDLDGLDGLVLPGGESTTLSMLLESTGLYDAIAERLSTDGTTRVHWHPGVHSHDNLHWRHNLHLRPPAHARPRHLRRHGPVGQRGPRRPPRPTLLRRR